MNQQPGEDPRRQAKSSEQPPPDPEAEAAGAEAGEEREEAAEAEAEPVDETEQALAAAAKAEAERDRYFQQLQRLAADHQNYIRRSEQELTRSTERTRGDLLKQFLPVLDHFDNALAAEPESADGKQLYQGMQIVRDELMKVLEQQGVQRLDVAVGEAFDPHRHEALMQQQVEGVDPGHVAATMQPGYVYGERTLRPAKVAVAPNP